MSPPEESLLDRLQTAFQQRSLVKLVLSAPQRKSRMDVLRFTIRTVSLKDGPQLQWTARIGSQERHENLPLDASLKRVGDLFPESFREANLLTTGHDYQFRSRDGRSIRTSEQASRRPTPADDHNRSKHYVIPEGQPCPFLEAVGVMTSDGRVRASMTHKFHQINRFLELINDIVPHLPPEGRLRVVDFGSGKSYLTLALHHLLTRIHQRQVRILAIDQNATLLETCRGLCAQLAIDDIEFHAEAIGAVQFQEPVDLAVALHACDVATDLALRQSVRWQARVILAAPCCQHEVARSIHSDSLQLVLKHGILKERFAALATDALRAEALENAGYRTQILEFVDLDHTPKNLLLRAVRRETVEPARTSAYAELKQILGLSRIATDAINES